MFRIVLDPQSGLAGFGDQLNTEGCEKRASLVAMGQQPIRPTVLPHRRGAVVVVSCSE